MLVYIGYLSLLFSGLVFYVYKKSQKRKLATQDALDLAILIMIFGFWGARLTHVFYENPEIYSENWLRVFYFWYGGFVYYGGAIAAFLACAFLIWRRKLSFPLWLDFYAPIAALGYGLGRVSCFITGCCYGQTCDLPWAVSGRHPTQLYAVIWELTLFAALIRLEKKNLRPGSLFLIWLLFHSLGRLMMEYFRDDFRGAAIFGISISALISWILLVISLGVLVFVHSRPRALSRKSGSVV